MCKQQNDESIVSPAKARFNFAWHTFSKMSKPKHTFFSNWWSCSSWWTWFNHNLITTITNSYFYTFLSLKRLWHFIESYWQRFTDLSRVPKQIRGRTGGKKMKPLKSCPTTVSPSKNCLLSKGKCRKWMVYAPIFSFKTPPTVTLF